MGNRRCARFPRPATPRHLAGNLCRWRHLRTDSRPRSSDCCGTSRSAAPRVHWHGSASSAPRSRWPEPARLRVLRLRLRVALPQVMPRRVARLQATLTAECSVPAEAQCRSHSRLTSSAPAHWQTPLLLPPYSPPATSLPPHWSEQSLTTPEHSH